MGQVPKIGPLTYSARALVTWRIETLPRLELVGQNGLAEPLIAPSMVMVVYCRVRGAGELDYTERPSEVAVAAFRDHPTSVYIAL